MITQIIIIPTTPIDPQIILIRFSIALKPFICFVNTSCLVEVRDRFGHVVDQNTDKGQAYTTDNPPKAEVIYISSV